MAVRCHRYPSAVMQQKQVSGVVVAIIQRNGPAVSATV
jgi:hypothetical protein